MRASSWTSVSARNPPRATAALSAVVLITAYEVRAVDAMQIDPSKTTYGERNPGGPNELELFAFLIGKWEGTGKPGSPTAHLPSPPVSLIGRYVLDDTAIADEGHSVTPDGSPYLRITVRYYDATRKTWIIEYLNVSNSFVRKQVNGVSGAVTVDGRTVTVSSESPDMSIREHYRPGSRPLRVPAGCVHRWRAQLE